MFCHNCGKKISKTAQFCPYCGAKIAHLAQTGANVQAQKSSQRPITPVVQRPISHHHVHYFDFKHYSKKTWAGIGIAVFVVLALIFMVGHSSMERTHTLPPTKQIKQIPMNKENKAICFTNNNIWSYQIVGAMYSNPHQKNYIFSGPDKPHGNPHDVDESHNIKNYFVGGNSNQSFQNLKKFAGHMHHKIDNIGRTHHWNMSPDMTPANNPRFTKVNLHGKRATLYYETWIYIKAAKKSNGKQVESYIIHVPIKAKEIKKHGHWNIISLKKYKKTYKTHNASTNN